MLFSNDSVETAQTQDALEYIQHNRDDTMLDSVITGDEILHSIQSLRGSCASSLDGTCIEMHT